MKRIILAIRKAFTKKKIQITRQDYCKLALVRGWICESDYDVIVDRPTKLTTSGRGKLITLFAGEDL